MSDEGMNIPGNLVFKSSPEVPGEFSPSFPLTGGFYKDPSLGSIRAVGSPNEFHAR
jgi:hypothetical protein